MTNDERTRIDDAIREAKDARPQTREDDDRELEAWARLMEHTKKLIENRLGERVTEAQAAVEAASVYVPGLDALEAEKAAEVRRDALLEAANAIGLFTMWLFCKLPACVLA